MPTGPNRILDSSNNATSAMMQSISVQITSDLPLGKTAGGEVGLKTVNVGSAAGSSEMVEGTTANTSAFSDNPVIVGGVDAGGNAAQFLATSSGIQITIPSSALGGAVLASKAYSASNQTLAASNANRRGLLLFNNTDGNLFVKFGATATATTSFTVKILAGGYWEMPQPAYTGIVDGIGTAGTTGNTLVTEIT